MLQVKDVYKRFQTDVLKGVSFAVEQGIVLSIAGSNGAGKSTLLSILATILKPDKGHILLDNQDLFSNKMLVRSAISYVPQDNALFESLTVKDNMEFWASAYQTTYNHVHLVDDILAKKVSSLSGGMKRRLNIAISLINKPAYILFDEPSAALDLSMKKEVHDIIWQLRSEGCGIIMASHDPEELYSSDILCILKKGNFVFHDSPKKLAQPFENFQSELFQMINEGGN